MKEEILPVGFNGTFYFTNYSNEEFKARWNSKEYTFPPESSVPMIILDATPIEIQNIRKKFAKELAEREFFKSDRMAYIEAQNPRHTLSSFRSAVGYQDSDLKPFIQRSLEPLKVEKMKVHLVPTGSDDQFHKDENGKPVTPVVTEGTDLAVGTTV